MIGLTLLFVALWQGLYGNNVIKSIANGITINGRSILFTIILLILAVISFVAALWTYMVNNKQNSVKQLVIAITLCIMFVLLYALIVGGCDEILIKLFSEDRLKLILVTDIASTVIAIPIKALIIHIIIMALIKVAVSIDLKAYLKTVLIECISTSLIYTIGLASKSLAVIIITSIVISIIYVAKLSLAMYIVYIIPNNKNKCINDEKPIIDEKLTNNKTAINKEKPSKKHISIKSVISVILIISIVLSGNTKVLAAKACEETTKLVGRTKEYMDATYEDDDKTGDVTEEQGEESEQQSEEGMDSQEGSHGNSQDGIVSNPEEPAGEQDEIVKTPLEVEEINEYTKLYGDPVYEDENTKTYKKNETEFVTIVDAVDESEVEVKKEIDESGHVSYEGETEDAKVCFLENSSNEISVINEDSELSITPLYGDYTRSANISDAILYSDVFEGIDVEYRISEGMLKENIILNHMVEKESFEYAFPADIYDAELIDNQIYIYRYDSKEPLYIITAPIMYDSDGNESLNIELSLKKVLNQYVMTVIPDGEWLKEEGRVYPVYIDPTITFGGSNIGSVTVSSSYGKYGGISYGYVGYTLSKDIGVPNAKNLEKTRMLLTVPQNAVQGINSEAKIDSAYLVMHEYMDYSGGNAVFACYRLEDAWNGGTIKWNQAITLNKSPSGENFTSKAGVGTHRFDVRDTVNGWFTGIYENNGFMIVANDELGKGGAFYTPYSSSTNPGQEAFIESQKPALEINWSIPDPVDENRPLNDIAVNVRTLMESSRDGKLYVRGVLTDGIATPGANVHIALNDQSKGYEMDVASSYSYKYPDTKEFEAALGDKVTKYRDKISNYQVSTPFTDYDMNNTYELSITASKAGGNSLPVKSDSFLIYSVTRFDNISNIAAYYGVDEEKIMYDNRVFDMLLVENNTLFIRNPKTNIPYNPGELTDAPKAGIDSLLMGRGLHCEFGFEPVNINTGNYVLEAMDVCIPDFGGYFSVGRTYNSMTASINGVFGRGMSTSLDKCITALANGDTSYVRGDGSVMTFTYKGDGTYEGPEGYYASLERIKTGEKTGDFGAGEETYDVYEYRITNSDGSKELYDSRGRLKSTTTIDGFTTTYNYSDSGSLESIVSPSGAILLITMEGGHVKSIKLPNGGIIGYEYGESNDLIGVIDVLGNRTSYSYDDKHHMTKYIDANNNLVVENVYDDYGRVIRQTDGEGGVCTLAYEVNKTTTKDALGNELVYHFDDQKRTIEIDYPDGTSKKSEYKDNNLVKVINRDLTSESYEYDSLGNVITKLYGNGNKDVMNYDGHYLTSTIDVLGNKTTFSYDERGNLTEITYSDLTTQSYSYDSLNRMTASVDGNGYVTNYEYDNCRLSSKINSEGYVTKYSYDVMGNIVCVTNPDNTTIRYTYDKAGNVISKMDEAGHINTYTYDAVGNEISSTDGMGYVISNTYSPLNRLIRVKDQNGRVVGLTYDKNGNRVKETNPDGSSVTYTYDEMGRIVTKQDAEGHINTYEYDAGDRIISITDANGYVSCYEYDNYTGMVTKSTNREGRVVTNSYNEKGIITKKSYEDSSSDEYFYDSLYNLTKYIEKNSLVVEYSYDNSKRLTGEVLYGIDSSKTRGLKKNYTYDKSGNITDISMSNGYKEHMEYDKRGNLISKTDALGNKTRYEYNSTGQVIKEITPLGYEKKYEYNANNLLVKMTDTNNAVTLITYDKVGNIVSTKNGGGYTTYLEYDLNYNIKESKDANGNKTLYEYDELGNITAITDALGNRYELTYDCNSNMTSLTTPNKASIQYQYNKEGQLTKETSTTGLVKSYTYNELGQLVDQSDNMDRKTSFSYDKLGNITSKTDAYGNTVSYEYDSLGNLINETDSLNNQTSYTYDITGNVLSKTDALKNVIRYSYDLNGNLISETDSEGEKTLYQYDGEGNLSLITDALGNKTSLFYDGAGNNIKTINAEGNASYASYDLLNRVIEETDCNGNKVNYTYDGTGNIIKTTDAKGNSSSYEYDELSRLIKETDREGNLTTYTYDSMGNLISSKDALLNENVYNYDKASRLISTIDGEGNKTEYKYDKASRVIEEIMPNGESYTYEYDKLDRKTITIIRETHIKNMYWKPHILTG